MSPRAIPIAKQFLLVEVHPLQQQSLGASIEALIHIDDVWRADPNSGEPPTVRGMNVRWIVVKIEHRHDDSTKS
jgi:hypothetical protein